MLREAQCEPGDSQERRGGEEMMRCASVGGKASVPPPAENARTLSLWPCFDPKKES